METFFAILIPWCLVFFLTIGLITLVEPDNPIKLRGWIKVFLFLPLVWIVGIGRGIYWAIKI